MNGQTLSRTRLPVRYRPFASHFPFPQIDIYILAVIQPPYIFSHFIIFARNGDLRCR
jgi:hypothetical protein